MKLDLGGLNNGLQRYIINDSDLQTPVEIPYLPPHADRTCIFYRIDVLGKLDVYHYYDVLLRIIIVMTMQSL